MSAERSGFAGLLQGLISALRDRQSAPQETNELLDDHEKSLRQLYPEGHPSGDGSEQFDTLTELREDEVRWQAMHRRRLKVVGLLGAIVALAIVVAVALERFAG